MSKSALAQLEQQKQRVENLKQRSNAIAVKLESARQQYAEAQRMAAEKFETSDLDVLRTMLRDLEAKNAAQIAEYLTAVDDYEKYIVRIEKALADPEVMSEVLLNMDSSTVAEVFTSTTPANTVSADQDPSFLPSVSSESSAKDKPFSFDEI